MPVVNDELPSSQHASPVVAFIIGLAIILLSSILNAAGLNLTKLDHVSAQDHMRRLVSFEYMSVLGPYERDS